MVSICVNKMYVCVCVNRLAVLWYCFGISEFISGTVCNLFALGFAMHRTSEPLTLTSPTVQKRAVHIGRRRLRSREPEMRRASQAARLHPQKIDLGADGLK